MNIIDGLVNFVSRIGTGADKAANGRYAITPFDGIDIEEAYRTSWFRKICDIPPFDEVREWRTWTGADEDQITLIDAEEKRLGLRQKINLARTLARKDGGAAIVLGVGGNPAMPLNPESVGKGGLKFINVCTRLEITPLEQDRDATSPTFGMPRSYRLSGTSTEIDASRVIKFEGNPIRMAGYWDGWGESVWIELRDAVRHADQIAAGVASLVDEAKVDVVKIEGLMGGLATTEYENLLVKRWGAMGTFKSSVNALLLDAKDEYEQKTITFAGMPDIQDRALMIMSGMADIPATRLLGRSPQGMNATGDSDMRNYYDRIRSGQMMFLQPVMEPLDECLIRSALGKRDDQIYYEWNPLYTMTEAEAATVEKTFADAANIYATTALIPDTALAAMVKDGLIERGQWPGAQQAFEDAEAEGDLPGLLAEPTPAEQAAEAAKTAIATAQAADPTGFGATKPRLVASNDARFTDSAPRTLYVRRDVTNVAEITKWAKAQGFSDIQPDLHVTIVYSDTPVDWMKMGSAWQAEMTIPAGGPRQVGRFGKYIVLLFASDELGWRNSTIRERGASANFDEYQPHISIQVDEDAIITDEQIAAMRPYVGEIKLGPEIFEEVKP
jgi:phage-related protein (TIGR01555 family)